MSRAVANTYVMVPDRTNGIITSVPIRYDHFVQRLFKADSEKLMKLHAAIGVAGEVAELDELLHGVSQVCGQLLDSVKRDTIYNKPEMRPHILEELGDIRFYIQAVQQMYDISEQELLQANADKLAKRYIGLTYSDDSANERADKSESSN